MRSWVFPLMDCSPKMRGGSKRHGRSVSIPALVKFLILRYWSPIFVVIMIDLTPLWSYIVGPPSHMQRVFASCSQPSGCSLTLSGVIPLLIVHRFEICMNFVDRVLSLRFMLDALVRPLRMRVCTFLLLFYMLLTYTVVIERGYLHNDLLCHLLCRLCLTNCTPFHFLLKLTCSTQSTKCTHHHLFDAQSIPVNFQN